MRVAHLADLHLGFRAYGRATATGLNQREADVANAFRAAIDGVIAAAPDAVVIAGDLFHNVRPSNTSIVFAFRQFARLRAALPQVPIVVAAGNHETPKSSETGSILPLYEELGIKLATDRPAWFRFPDLDLAVFVVPEAAMWNRPSFAPEGAERYRVLVLHGEIAGVVPGSLGTGPALRAIAPEDLTSQPWSYVALGHYHVQQEVAPRIWYAGSLEYTSSDIWRERREEERLGIVGKGWLLADLAHDTVERRPIAAVRLVYDAPEIDAAGLPAEDLDRLITEAIAAVPGGLTDAIVRVKVINCPRSLSREIDHAAVRAFKGNALHFHLDMQPPEATPGAAGSKESRAAMRRMPLEALFQNFLQDRVLPARVERTRFVEAGLAALADVDTPEAPL